MVGNPKPIEPDVRGTDEKKMEFVFLQYREVLNRKMKKFNYKDPGYEIVHFKYVFVKKDLDSVLAGVAMHKNGMFDLYYAGFRVFSSKPNDVLVRGVDITFEGIYLDMEVDHYETAENQVGIISSQREVKKVTELLRVDRKTKPERIRLVELKLENEISYKNSQFKESYTMTNLFFFRIRNFCKIYSSFNLLDTYMIVSHGRIISKFNLLT